MKKIVAFILAIVMITCSVTLTSCMRGRGNGNKNSDIDVKQTIKDSSDKMDTLNTCSGTSNMTIDIKSQGVTMTIEMDYLVKMADLQTNNPKRYADVTIVSVGQSETGVIYSEGEWDYVVTGNEKYKTRVDDDDDKDVTEYVDSVYEKATVKETNKGTEIKMTFTDSQLREYFSSTYEAVIEMFELLDYESYATVTSAYLKLIINDDGYVSEEEINFKFRFDVEGETVEIYATHRGTYEKYNEPVTITPPQGYLSFMEKIDGDII